MVLVSRAWLSDVLPRMPEERRRRRVVKFILVAALRAVNSTRRGVKFRRTNRIRRN